VTAGCLDLWVEFVGEKKRLRRSAAKVVKRWNNLAVAGSLEAWSFFVSERKRMRIIGQRVALRMRTRCQMAAFQSWIAMVQERVAHRVRMKRAVEQLAVTHVSSFKWRWQRPPPKLRSVGALSGLLVHVWNAAQRRAFHLWHSWVIESITAELHMELEVSARYLVGSLCSLAGDGRSVVVVCFHIQGVQCIVLCLCAGSVLKGGNTRTCLSCCMSYRVTCCATGE